MSTQAFYTTEEVAQMFRVAPITISRWEKAGYINSIRMGGLVRYTQAEIDRLQQEGKKDDTGTSPNPNEEGQDDIPNRTSGER